MSKEEYIPKDVLEKYETHDYKHAAAILANEFPKEFAEIITVLRSFSISEKDLLKEGGNESDIPKNFSKLLRPLNWKEEKLSIKMVVNEIEKPIDSHKVDYCKGRVAFDLEWNAKDQTFDRDLYAFRLFWEYDKISVGVLVTRSEELNNDFKRLGIMKKYGASTTWIGKLLPRLNSGRNGGCPVLVFAIKSNVIIKDKKNK